MAAVEYDTWQQVEAELACAGAGGAGALGGGGSVSEQKSGGGSGGGAGAGLVVACFAHAWNPGAVFTALAMEQLRSGPDISFSQAFIIDPDVDRVAMHEHGAKEGNQPLDVVASPAFAFFWQGKIMTVRRPDWDDDVHVIIICAALCSFVHAGGGGHGGHFTAVERLSCESSHRRVAFCFLTSMTGSLWVHWTATSSLI